MSWCRNLHYWKISIALGVTSIVVLAWLYTRPALVPCGDEYSDTPGEYKFKAVQVVVQPWQGRHQVYALFKVPQKYKRHWLYSVTLVIDGFDEKYSAGSTDIEEHDNIVPEEGHYFRRAYIPTRTAWWFLLTGRFGDLRLPCHWWLVYADQTI